MRALLIPSALAAALALTVPVDAEPASLLPAEPEAAAPASRLAPLAAGSAWTPRFEAAASELAAALRSRDEARWGPMLGGQWLAAADRARVRALLADPASPFVEALVSGGPARQAILGWSAPASLNAAERAAIEAGQQAEALVCWSAGGDGAGAWPSDGARGRQPAGARLRLRAHRLQPARRIPGVARLHRTG
ncbi:hypothetical protein [Sphingopyxis sp. PET50]|uniref:hypothetical protein n=1 Tax=Sphingopyxis sp. PET50 TaxID=2976533 RepID=UPI0021B04772|nr:hypothetical protein [Sphingopyxis sp. PET50]